MLPGAYLCHKLDQLAKLTALHSRLQLVQGKAGLVVPQLHTAEHRVSFYIACVEVSVSVSICAVNVLHVQRLLQENHMETLHYRSEL